MKYTTKTKTMLADEFTPVSIYQKIRRLYNNTLLLEAGDYNSSNNASSYICFDSLETFSVSKNIIFIEKHNEEKKQIDIAFQDDVKSHLNAFINELKESSDHNSYEGNGLYGFSSYSSVRFFETIDIVEKTGQYENIPELTYSYYRFVFKLDHFRNILTITENCPSNEKSKIKNVLTLMENISSHKTSFNSDCPEESPVSDEEYMEIVSKGKEHCKRGDVFQIVLSRPFSKKYTGDDFIVYRTLRSINPSPYLFYLDQKEFKIFGSSPEAQIKVTKGKAIINPIAGTYKRTGNDETDKIKANDLLADEKENAEHVMLVDLARNDLSRNCRNVKVDSYKEIHYYSHVLHMVSEVSGEQKQQDAASLFADTFPAGTLTGAPKYKAMELIEKYESTERGFYGGAIGFIGLNGDINHAIMIRTFLSLDNTLHYRAGAGVVERSDEESELNEVNNKLNALRKAIKEAQNI